MRYPLANVHLSGSTPAVAWGAAGAAETSPAACAGERMSTFAQIPSQLIEALALDLIGPTPDVLAKLALKGRTEEVNLGPQSKGAKQAAKAGGGGASGARRGRPPTNDQVGENGTNKGEQMGLGYEPARSRHWSAPAHQAPTRDHHCSLQPTPRFTALFVWFAAAPRLPPRSERRAGRHRRHQIDSLQREES